MTAPPSSPRPACRWLLVALMALPFSSADELRFPSILDADDGPIDLDLSWTEVDPGFGGRPFRTRAIGGSVPGPTVMVSAGTTLEVRFRNLLEEQPGAFRTYDPVRFNRYGDPDVANLHFHGGHVSSVLPADDTTLIVQPGRGYNFSVPFPEDHMPGTHWLHPHHHGSSSLHLSGGAACAMIVKDPPGSLPEEVENAGESLLVFQDWDVDTMVGIAGEAGDAVFGKELDQVITGARDYDSVGGRFVTVNGMYRPTMTVERGEWRRWRMLYAGWQDLPLKFKAKTNDAGCEFHLLAKDGIFIADYPRHIAGTIPLPPGGRADFMVRCNDVGTSEFSALARDTLTVVSVSKDGETGAIDAAGEEASRDDPATLDDEALADASVTRDASLVVKEVPPPLVEWSYSSPPDYLQSVLEENPTDGCQCPYELNGYDDTSRINGKTYRIGNHFQHTTHMGALVQRDLTGIQEHSYHQHIYPFQLFSGFVETDYFRIGDWHDTILDEEGKKKSGLTIWRVKYRVTDIPGKMMVHCHNTMHADRGMMAKEYVRDAAEGEEGVQCKCDLDGEISGPGLVDDVTKISVADGGQWGDVGVEEDDSAGWARGAKAYPLLVAIGFLLVAL